jgi:hypothetical protein
MSDTSTPAAPAAPPVTKTPPANAAQQPGGTHDDPGDLQYGEFGLNGDMTDAIGKALTDAGWDPNFTPQSPDDGVVDIPSEHNPPADTAPGASQPDPAPATPPGDGQGAGAGGDAPAGDGAASAPDGAPPGAGDTSTPTPTEPFDANSYFQEWLGQPLSREDAQQLAATITDLNRLTPEQRANLDRVLAGEQPNAYPATTGQPVQQPQPQPQPQPADDPALAVLGPRPDDEYLAQQWDLTARGVRAQADQLAAIQQDIARTTQAQQEIERAQAADRITTATNEWRDNYPMLTDAEFDRLIDSSTRAGTFDRLVAAHNGDFNAATKAILEQHLWTDAAIRDKVIANIASGRVAGDATVQDPASPVAQQQAQIEQARRQRASSVAGGGGQAPSRATNPGDGGNVPATPEGRKAALQAEIAAHMEG